MRVECEHCGIFLSDVRFDDSPTSAALIEQSHNGVAFLRVTADRIVESGHGGLEWTRPPSMTTRSSYLSLYTESCYVHCYEISSEDSTVQYEAPGDSSRDSRQYLISQNSNKILS